MQTTEKLREESIQLLEEANQLCKKKDFEEGSKVYISAIQKIMSSILQANLIPHGENYLSTYAVFTEYKRDTKFHNSINDYTLEMIGYFIKKVGYFADKNAFENNFIKDIKKVHKYLLKELDSLKIKNEKNSPNPADTVINAIKNNGIDFFM